MLKKVRKAVFPVGGLGTRFLPATKAMPKEMLPVVDRPLIQYAVDEAREAGIEEFIFVTGRGKVIIRDHFDRSYELESVLRERGKNDVLDALQECLPSTGSIAYMRQQEPQGLGHAVWCARDIIGHEAFAVILPDELVLHERGCLAQMVDAWNQKGGNIVAVAEVPEPRVNQYGIVAPAADDGRIVEVKGLVEKPDPATAPSNLAMTGRYILCPEIFKHLQNQRKGAGGEIQLTDAMPATLGDFPFHGVRFDGQRFDCGDKAGYLAANIAYAMRRDDIAPRLAELIPDLRTYKP